MRLQEKGYKSEKNLLTARLAANKEEKEYKLLENPWLLWSWNWLIRSISLFLLLLSGFLALKDGLKLDWWNTKELLIICGVTAVVTILAYSNRILTVVGIVLGTVLEVCLVLFQYEWIEQEFIKCYYHVIPYVNSYYRTNYAVVENVTSENGRIFLIFLAVFSGLWIGAGVVSKRMRYLFMMPLAIAFISGFFLGLAPGMEAVLCLIGGLGFLLLPVVQKRKNMPQSEALEARRERKDVWKNDTGTEQKANRFAFLLLCLSVGIMAFIYKPISENLLERHDALKKFQLAQEDKMLAFMNSSSFLSDLFWQMGGQENQARLTNEAPKLSKEEIFTITVEHYPREPIYVKDFVGVYYDKGVWYPASEETFLEFAGKQKVVTKVQVEDSTQRVEISKVEETEAETPEEAVTGRDIQEMAFELSNWEDNSETVRIQTRKRTGNLSLQLYQATIPENAQIVGDIGIRMKEKEYEMQRIYMGGYSTSAYYTSLSSTYSSGIVGIMDAYYTIASSMYLPDNSTYDAYKNYVYDVYLIVPTEQLEKIINNWVHANDSLIQDCTYSFDLEPVPEGQDIIEYFLFEQKKGYCMHFASAYALMLRMRGIPSRYVGGYIVTPEQFQENEDGTYTAVVTGERAHAWVEYYNDFYGWSAYEATPSAYYTGLMHMDAEGSVEQLVENLQLWEENDGVFEKQEPEEEEIKEETPEQKPDVKKEPQQQEKEENKTAANGNHGANGGIGQGKNKSSHLFWQAVKNIFIAVLVCGVLVSIIRLRRKFILKQRKQRFGDADTKKAAMAIVKETLQLLKLSGISLSEQADEMLFAKETEQAVECLEQGEFVRFMEIARSARYGNAKIPKQQMKCLYAVYQKLMVYETTRLKGYQRMWYRYGQIWI